MDSTHPHPERLQAFGLGQLSPAEAAALEGHVAGCPACGLALASVPDDRLVQLLREPDAGPEGDTPTQEATGPKKPAPAVEVPPELAQHPRYRVVRALGAGGMGVVYLAEHRLMERVVALKVINRNLVDRPETVERFAREVKAAARLTHPNIVRAYDAEQAGDLHFLVMEYIEGTSLARRVEAQGPLPVAQACNYTRQAAMGLQHACEQGMVHRDIKPHNLMLTPRGWVKVLDFGLARFVRECGSAGLTPNQMLLGTPDYIAPEQASDARRADIRSDIYSLGCTLYFLLTGRPPFPEGDFVEKVLAHLTRTPRPVTELRPDVPPELGAVVARMMARDPAQRYPTPTEVAQALVPFLKPAAPTPSAAPMTPAVPLAPVARPAPPVRAGQRPPRRWGWPLGVGGAVLAVAVALVLVHVSQRHPSGGSRPAGRTPPGQAEGTAGERPAGPAAAERRYLGHREEVRCGAFTGDGRRFLSGSFNQLFLWEVDSNTETSRFEGEQGWVHCVAVAPDGHTAISGGQDRILHIWDVDKGKEKGRVGKLDVAASPIECIECVAFSPDGSHFLYTQDGVVRLCETETHKEVERFPGRVACFSADGRKVLSAANQTLYLSEEATGAELGHWTSSLHAIVSVALSPDGTLALAGSIDNRDKAVGVLDIRAGKETLLEGHTASITGVAFCPDGRRALSSSKDRTLRLWDVRTKGELHRFEGHTSGVSCLTISTDGRWALSGGEDASVRLWRLPK